MSFKKALTLAAAAMIVTLAACGDGGDAPAATAPATPAPVTTSIVSNALASGAFAGRSDHITTGGASIIGSQGAYELVLAADFSLDGAPDPIVGFGKDGKYNAATKIGALKNKSGAQRYKLPANFNLSDVSEVYIWCEQFDVPLGVATF